MDKQRYSRVPNAVYDDPDLNIYDRAVYGMLLRHDWHQQGWQASHKQMAAEAGCCTSKVQRSLTKLQARGWVRWQGPVRHPFTYFVLFRYDTASVPHTAPRDTTASHSSVPHTAQFGTTYRTPPICSVPHTDNKENHTYSQGRNESTANAVGHSASHEAGADAPPPAQKQTRAPKKAKAAERTPEQREDTRVLAEAWMTANAVDPATVGRVTIVQYNAWAATALKHRDRETLTRFLRWLWSKRKQEGAQFTITPRILDERIGQWLDLPGKPERYKPPPDKKDAAAAERRRKDAEAGERQEALYRMQMAAAGLPL